MHGAPSQPSASCDAEAVEIGDARDAGAELQVRARAVDDARAVARDLARLVVGQLDAVREDRARAAHAPRAQDLDVVAAERRANRGALARVLGDVRVDDARRASLARSAAPRTSCSLHERMKRGAYA